MDHMHKICNSAPELQPERKRRGMPPKSEEHKAAVRKAKYEQYRLAGYFKAGAKYNRQRPLKTKSRNDVYTDHRHAYRREYMREYRKKQKLKFDHISLKEISP